MENIIKEMFLVTIKHGYDKLKLLLPKNEFENLESTDYETAVSYYNCKFKDGRWVANNSRGAIVEIIQSIGEISARIPGV